MPQEIEIQTQELPTVLGFCYSGTFVLFSYEISNSTGGDITYEVWDGIGHTIVPPQLLSDGKTESYKADRGRTMMGGMKWKASVPGVIGYATGEMR